MAIQTDEIKAIKSPEEIELIKRTAALQDAAFEHVRKVLKPGKKDFEIHAEAHYSTTMNGSERGLVIVGSGRPGVSLAITITPSPRLPAPWPRAPASGRRG